MKVRVKICGITRTDDALLAEELGASAVGFVFYPGSPRYIPPVKAGYISEKLGPFIVRVGVFVDEEPSEVLNIIHTARLNVVQLHGSEDMEYVKKLKGIQVIKAFRVSQDFDCKKLSGYEVDAFLLDTCDESGCYGGTGKTFEWDKALECYNYGKIILAGGLNSSNVQEAIKIAKPWAVDVSSGVEISPGIKDEDKMREFFIGVNNVIL